MCANLWQDRLSEKKESDREVISIGECTLFSLFPSHQNKSFWCRPVSLSWCENDLRRCLGYISLVCFTVRMNAIGCKKLRMTYHLHLSCSWSHLYKHISQSVLSQNKLSSESSSHFSHLLHRRQANENTVLSMQVLLEYPM